MLLTALVACVCNATDYQAGDSIEASDGDAGVLVAAGQCVQGDDPPAPTGGTTRLVVGNDPIFVDGTAKVLYGPGVYDVDDATVAALWGVQYAYFPTVGA
jgi:hypothetical protein